MVGKSILGDMRSTVAQRLRKERRREESELPLAERLALLRRLSEDGITLLMSTQKIDRAEAIRRIRHSRTIGRRPSVANTE